MSNLKDDLNAYLNRNNETTGSTFINMYPLGKFLKKADHEENEDLLTNNTKYFTNKEYCPTISRFQRIVAFGICMLVGVFFFSASMFFLPVLVIKSRKFALLFTFSSISFQFSFAFLWGPVNYLKHVFSIPRLPFTAAYFSSLIATLYFSLYLKSTPLTALCAVFQVIALIWYLITYIPGGQTGLSFFRTIFSSAVSSTISRTLPV